MLRVTEKVGNLRVGFSFNETEERYYWKLEEFKNGGWEATAADNHYDRYRALDQVLDILYDINDSDAQALASRIDATVAA